MTAPDAPSLPPIIPREVLFGNPERAFPQISPDGRRLAYLAPHQGVLNVWLRTLGRDDERPVTREARRDLHDYFWAEDNQHLIYLQDRDGDENWHYYAVELATGSIRDMTPIPDVQARLVAHDPKYPRELLVAMNARTPELHDVYRVEPKTGSCAIEEANPGRVVEYVADQQMKVRAALASTPAGGFELLVRDTPRAAWRATRTFGPEEQGEVRGFSPDGRAVYLATNQGTDTSELHLLELATGKEQRLAARADVDLGPVLIQPRTHAVQAACFVRDRVEWQVLDQQIAEDFEMLHTVCDGDFEILNRDHADQNWIICYETDTTAQRYYIYDRATRQATFLFHAIPALADYTLAPVRPVRITSRDGLKLHAYLTLPVGVEPRGLPMVVNVHGGPWHRDYWGYEPVAQWLANRGYACLQVNFRGSTGFGKAFVQASFRQWGAKMHDDLVDAVQWAVQQRIADPKKVAVLGGSYGGYAALVGLTFTPELFCCAISLCGPSNLITFIQTIPDYWKPYRDLMDVRVGNADTEQDFLLDRSPLFRADRIRSPLMVAQGANDPRVKRSESEQMVEAARKAGKDVVFQLFADEGHGLVRQANRLKFFAAAEQFLARHLPGRAEPE